MALARLIIHAAALLALAAVAVALGRWLRDPEPGASLVGLLVLVVICAVALRRLYGPYGLVALRPAEPRDESAAGPRDDDPASTAREERRRARGAGDRGRSGRGGDRADGADPAGERTRGIRDGGRAGAERGPDRTRRARNRLRRRPKTDAEPLWAGGADPADPDPRRSAAGGAGIVNLNTASEAELLTLPGIGPRMAIRIQSARPFRSIDDLAELPGFTPARVRAIADRIRV